MKMSNTSDTSASASASTGAPSPNQHSPELNEALLLASSARHAWVMETAAGRAKLATYEAKLADYQRKMQLADLDLDDAIQESVAASADSAALSTAAQHAQETSARYVLYKSQIHPGYEKLPWNTANRLLTSRREHARAAQASVHAITGAKAWLHGKPSPPDRETLTAPDSDGSPQYTRYVESLLRVFHLMTLDQRQTVFQRLLNQEGPPETPAPAPGAAPAPAAAPTAVPVAAAAAAPAPATAPAPASAPAEPDTKKKIRKIQCGSVRIWVETIGKADADADGDGDVIMVNSDEDDAPPPLCAAE